jgi:hypothetical protein
MLLNTTPGHRLDWKLTWKEERNTFYLQQCKVLTAATAVRWLKKYLEFNAAHSKFHNRKCMILSKPLLLSAVATYCQVYLNVTFHLSLGRQTEPFPRGCPTKTLKAFASIILVDRVSCAPTPKIIFGAHALRNSSTTVTFLDNFHFH